MFGLFRKKPDRYFSDTERERIVNAIRNAEQRTSGEVRIFIENKCEYIDPLRRAQEIFANLKMYETAERNAVLVYIAKRQATGCFW